MERNISQMQNEQKSNSNSNTNLYEIIESIRKQLLQRSSSYISYINSINPFNEIKPLTLNDFQQELLKYNVSIDSSYIDGIISQINTEIFRQLLNKTKQNIMQNLLVSSNDVIEPLTSIDLIQKYGINLDDKYINEILEYVNNVIKAENKKKNKRKKYKRLFECFSELAETDVQKDAIHQIMETGEYNGFKLNSMLSNKNDNENIEINRRIVFADMVLHDENLFLYLANNSLNVFHGTRIDALETILSKGLISSSELTENGIQLKTGEEYRKSNILGINDGKRGFVSLTDEFDIAATTYAGFPYEEQSEFAKQQFGKDLSNDDIPIIICFNGNDIKQKYNNSLITVKSDVTEIGLSSSINPSDIKCIITSYDKMEYVKSIASKYGIDVLGYDNNNRYEKRLINDKEGKFYSSNMEVDEKEFEKLKEKLKAKKDGQINLNDKSTTNVEQETKHLSEDLSMMYASDLKMDIVLNLTQQYNNGVPFIPITADNLISKYNINENVAQRLASEINTMVENYIHEKEYQKQNYTPFVLDGFEEETNSMGGKSR